MIRIQWLMGLLMLSLVGCSSLTDSMNEQAAMGTNVSEADMELRMDVIDRLQTDGITSRYTFGVVSESGVVTVYGSVPDEATRLRVRSVVESTPGVVQVHDQLRR